MLPTGQASWGEIGQGEHELALLGLGTVGFTADLVDAVTDATDFGLGLAGVLTIFSADADVFAEAVALGLQLLALGLGGATLLVERGDLVNNAAVVSATLVEAGFDFVGRLADELDIEHRKRSGYSGRDFRRGKRKRRREMNPCAAIELSRS